jgi:hypothetical protein
MRMPVTVSLKSLYGLQAQFPLLTGKSDRTSCRTSLLQSANLENNARSYTARRPAQGRRRPQRIGAIP